MRSKILSLVVFGVVFGVAAPVRLAAQLATDLARISLEAAGGLSAHAALHGLRATGVTKVGDKEVAFTLYSERPDRVRIETTSEGRTLVRAYDGVHAPWKKDDLLATPRRMAAGELRDFLIDADFDNPLYLPERRNISLDYAGEGVNEGRPCQKLLAVVRFTDWLTLYIDDETHLLVRRDITKRVRGRTAVVETHFSDFSPVAGVSLPRRIRTVVEGRELHETLITTWTANPTLPEGFFAPPVADWPLR